MSETIRYVPAYDDNFRMIGYREITYTHGENIGSIGERFITIDQAEQAKHIPEYDFIPVIGNKGGITGIPVGTVYKCPICHAIVDSQYERCPACNHRVDPD
jgi:rubrerythrin